MSPFSLTLDAETKEWLGDFYSSGKKVILEYGTGGSTVLALESNAETTVYACETDSVWLARLMLHLAEKQLQGRIYPVHLDIGPTGEWGVPVFRDSGFSAKRMQKFLQVATTPWRLLGRHGVNPDFVFIDGRWRKACFLAALLYCKSPMYILWDDYADRPQYHVFDALLKPEQMIGRSALYRVEPRQFDALEIINTFLPVFGDWG